jgi:hypothetical protein
MLKKVKSLATFLDDKAGFGKKTAICWKQMGMLMRFTIRRYTACHNNVPKKGWRHKCCGKKNSRNRNVFFDNYYRLRERGRRRVRSGGILPSEVFMLVLLLVLATGILGDSFC